MRVVVVAVSAVAAIVIVGALRLMAGPVDLGFLGLASSHQFETSGGKMNVLADRVTAEWVGLSQPMRVVFTGLHVTDGDYEVANAPSVALSFDPRSVVRGRLLPTSIVVERPEIVADIDREGGMMRRILATTDVDTQGGLVELLVEQLLAPANHTSLLGQLDTVEVVQARVTLRDVKSGIAWVAPDGRANLRRDASGVIIDADARFSNGGAPVDIALSAVYARDRSRISAEAKIDGIKPAMLADLSSDVTLLRGVDIALSGRLNIEATGAGAIRTVSVDVTGGSGTIELPGILPAVHRVRSINAHASVDAASHTSRIHHIDIDLGVAKASITGDGVKTEKGQVFTGRAELRNVETNRLADYWPVEFVSGGREWVLANLANGTIDLAADFGLSTPGNDLSQLAVTRAVAFLAYHDLKVRYMPQMPEIEGVSGAARFEGGTLHFDVTGGSAVGLRLTGGTIDLTNLDGPGPQQAVLRLPIAGTAAAAMALLARPKLGLPKDALYDPKRLGGEAAVELQLAFPLLASLAVNDLDVKAQATLTAFSLKQVLGAVDLTDAAAKLSYGDSQLSVTGQGRLDGTPVEIVWREMFAAKVPFRHRYELKGTLPTVLVAKAGIASPEPYVVGPVGTTLAYQVLPNGAGEVTGRFDLRGAKAAVAPLGWTKEAGSEGQLALNLRLAPGAKLLSAEFDGRGSGLAAKGAVRFEADGAVQQATLQQLAIGRSDLALEWKRTRDGVDLALHGRSIEMAKVREVLRIRDEAAAKTPGGAAAAARSRTNLSVQVGDVVVQRGSLGSLSGRLAMEGERVASAELSLGGGKGSAFRIVPSAGGRSLAIYVPDFGLLLRNAGWLDGLTDAYLDIQGRFDDSNGVSPLQGALKLGPYRLQKVTPRADVGNMNSTIEGLGRAGDALQQFNGLTAKIVKTGDRVDIREGRTSGSSIGLTVAGWLDLGNDTVRLRGAVVPGFALNNFLSNVPLLGPLLTGGRDGGVFAFSYRLEGPLDDLKPDVSMLSAVAPGALRELFSGSADDTPVPRQPDVDRSP